MHVRHRYKSVDREYAGYSLDIVRKRCLKASSRKSMISPLKKSPTLNIFIDRSIFVEFLQKLGCDESLSCLCCEVIL